MKRESTVSPRIPLRLSSIGGSVPTTSVEVAVSVVTEPNSTPVIPFLDRDAYPTLTELCSHLSTHPLFGTKEGEIIRALGVTHLTALEYGELYLLLEPLLESFRIKIDFQDTTLILRRPTATNESGAIGWHSLTSFIDSWMDMPPALKRVLHLSKGQPDVTLPPLAPGVEGLRVKCPDACLGCVDEYIPTLVLETGYSQTPESLHGTAKQWLWRMVAGNGVESVEEHAVQCVILFKINQKLASAWLPAFKDALGKSQNYQWDQLLAPPVSTFLSLAARHSAVLTVEIWRNEIDLATGGLKREPSVRNRSTCTVPICISTHTITALQLFETWIWEYLANVRDGQSNTSFEPLQNQPPVPRSAISSIAAHEKNYFTLYLDDLLSPKDIPFGKRGTIWVNVPVKIWVWGYLRAVGVGYKGWTEKQSAGQLEAMWAQWENANKENMDVVHLLHTRAVLAEVDIDEQGLKRRKAQNED
ncbi:hypothetical protein EV426DRAFT_573079 [Tirmania nivea]|nr:hypothetical protein EV426DRAFT_573079 [Tirmania nivea]